MHPTTSSIARFFAFAVFVSGLVSGSASADPRRPPPPPKEAFDACSGSKEGDACTVKVRGDEIHGTCTTFPEGGLACRPDCPPPPPREERGSGI